MQENPDVIDVEEYRPSKKCVKKVEMWIQELSLSEEDMEILLNPAEFLTDNIPFPSLSGLQSVACGLVMDFKQMGLSRLYIMGGGTS